MIILSFLLFIYLLIGIRKSRQIIKKVERTIDKYESNKPLNETEKTILNDLSNSNQMVENSVLWTYIILTFFWLPIDIYGKFFNKR